MLFSKHLLALHHLHNNLDFLIEMRYEWANGMDVGEKGHDQPGLK
jgi:hypothetical protein